MRKLNYLLFGLLSVAALSCNSGDDQEIEIRDYGVYKVVLEARGENYSAEAHMYNTNNVNLYDETGGRDIGSHAILEGFTGKQVYSTVKAVSNIVVQGILTSRNPASLKLEVYKDGKKVYENIASLKENNGGKDGTLDIVYSNLTE